MALFRSGGGGNSNNVYGMIIDWRTSDPSKKVTYIGTNANFTPAKVNLSTGEFDYGDWKDAWFMPKPCMLKRDGTVAYYLDKSDYTKKSDGTASDVTNTAFEGNAMMEWPQIWWKVIPFDSDGAAVVYFAPKQADENYHAWCNYDKDNVLKPHFYTAIYIASYVDGCARSMSGLTITTNRTVTQEVAAATANGDGWYTMTFAQFTIIALLGTLIGKSTNSQAVFGNGMSGTSESYVTTIVTGKADANGMFYGKNTTGDWLKIFGMEHLYSGVWSRGAGLIGVNGTYYYKLTRGTADGTTATDFNQTGSGYLKGTSIPAFNFTTAVKFYSIGIALGASTGNYDGYYYTDKQGGDTGYLMLYGPIGRGTASGLWCNVCTNGATEAYANTGIHISYT